MKFLNFFRIVAVLGVLSLIYINSQRQIKDWEVTHLLLFAGVMILVYTFIYLSLTNSKPRLRIGETVEIVEIELGTGLFKPDRALLFNTALDGQGRCWWVPLASLPRKNDTQRRDHLLWGHDRKWEALTAS